MNDWTSDDGTIRLMTGDCLERMRKLPAESVHAVVTSPPYFGLRSYLSADHNLKQREIGSEPTPQLFIDAMVAVFREIRRVLRDDGFVWMNIGDSYGGYHGNSRVPDAEAPSNKPGYVENMRQSLPKQNGHQLLVPHRVALALQADGWILRDTVVWAKRSAMPQSVNGVRWERCRVKTESAREPFAGYGASGNRTMVDHGMDIRNSARATWQPCPGCVKCRDNGGYRLRRGQARTTTSHEYLFMLTKTNDYFADMENWREASVSAHPSGNKHRKENHQPTAAGAHNARSVPWDVTEKRIRRSVWTLSSEPTRYKHYATFPSELVRRCLLMLSGRGCCPHCGAQWAPVIEMPDKPPREDYAGKNIEADPQHSARRMLQAIKAARAAGGSHDQPFRTPQVLAYRQTCDCPAHKPTGCVVLDPFSGTATTGQTARHLGHRYIGIDLNPDYVEHAKTNVMQVPRWRLRELQQPGKRKQRPQPRQKALF